MRRRPHVLVLVVGAAAALLLSAPALGAGVLSTETAALSSANPQQSPSIAIDPSAPLRLALAADDGAFAPPRTTTTSTLDWTAGAWTSPGSISHSGPTTAGQPDIAWGVDGVNQNVYAVEAGNASGNLCTTSSGVFFSISRTGGAGWSQGPGVNPASTTSELIEPAIAVDPNVPPSGRIYVAYTKLDWAATGCAGPPDSSQILLAYTDNEGISWPTRRVSPLATTGTAHYRSPSVAVLPDGRVTVAFRNDGTPSPQMESETCVSPSPPTGSYCGVSSGLVGPSTVLGDATAPAVVSGVAGAPTPSVVAAGGRVTVAWHASTPNGVRAFAAMSTNAGATFGPPQQIDPAGTGNQVAPRLAATATGRVDVAYLWDSSGTGIVNATTASAAPPLAGATTEAWGNPVIVQAVGTSSGGRRLGIATAAIPLLSPLPATVVAFADTSVPAGNQDVHVVGLLHGTSTPVIDSSQTVKASKNVSTIVHVDATDADGDPLTWSTGIGPTNPQSSVSTADPARGEFTYHAANTVGPDTFEAVATDGAGNQARAMINVNVVNDPPKIICSLLITRKDTPLPVNVEDCVRDPNDDPVTISLSDPVNGTVERQAGAWLFDPALHSTATGSFVLHASDDLGMTADQVVLVTVTSAIGKVNLTLDDAGRTRSVASGMAVRMKASAVDATGIATPIFWNFGDHSPESKGTLVAHRFRKPGTFKVTARAEGETRQMKVVVRRRAVELVGAPHIADGVMELTVRTRAAGKLVLRADSRSQTISVPAGLTEQALRIQVTTGPLVRLTLRLKPSKAAPTLRIFSLRRLVLVSPLSAG